MRGIAIASLILALVGVLYTTWAFGGFFRESMPLPYAVVPYMRAIDGIFTFGPPLLGFGFGVLALLAPVFGREREGTICASLGIGVSLLLLAFWLALRSGSWH